MWCDSDQPGFDLALYKGSTTMPFRDRSRLYPLAPGLYARSQAGYEEWQSLSASERARYIDAASRGPKADDATRQALRGRAPWAWRSSFGRLRSFLH
jgi:hypothetical protein